MKRLKGIVNELTQAAEPAQERIREFIFYSPKMPLRLHQQQLLSEAHAFTLPVRDDYFSGSEVEINCFSWGKGTNKLLLTHGWASKAADFYELIQELRSIDNLEIIAFDAPGNGSSISEFSNLMLYVESIKSISNFYAKPDVLIGHSLGGMANVLAIQNLDLTPRLLISIAPLIRLKENFEQSMQSVEIKPEARQLFFENFSKEFPVDAGYFNLQDRYELDENINHYLAYDPEDHISPLAYLEEFLTDHPAISAQAFEGVGHYKILKSVPVISEVLKKVSAVMSKDPA